ncbi:MAG: hypothetical protein JW913_09125 [Chitinispirillaceae bacterium]|nr:hypothetical protein [Chitinispirillaceae bacterium]
MLNLWTPSNPALLFSIDLSPFGKNANGVAVCNGLLAAAVENDDERVPGRLLLFRTWGNCPLINNIEIGGRRGE